MKIFVFGNPDLQNDSLPFRLLPKLKRTFPDIDFIHLDPNEEFEIPSELVVIDTVEGIKKVEIIDNLSLIKKSPRTTLHDFDLGALLFFLKKLGKVSKIKIIGVPPDFDEKKALVQIKLIIKKLKP